MVITVGDDTSAFYPVPVSFVATGGHAGIEVASTVRVEGVDEAIFSIDLYITTEEFRVVWNS